MKITFTDNKFVATVPYEDREKAKNAGFFWDKKSKCWFTEDIEKAAKLKDYFDKNAKNTLISYAQKILTEHFKRLKEIDVNVAEIRELLSDDYKEIQNLVKKIDDYYHMLEITALKDTLNNIERLTANARQKITKMTLKF